MLWFCCLFFGAVCVRLYIHRSYIIGLLLAALTTTFAIHRLHVIKQFLLQHLYIYVNMQLINKIIHQ